MPGESKRSPSSDEDHWKEFLAGGAFGFEKRGRKIFARLPANPRCRACNAPFAGVGGGLVRILLNKRQSTMDPRYCNACTDFMRQHPGGAEIPISMLFADVRGSTTLAENLPPGVFQQLINRFFRAATDVLLKGDAFIDRLIGDEVVAIFIPGLVGKDYARQAFESAVEIMKATGHADSDGPWIPVGAGIHSGLSYVGTVGSPTGAMDMTALGDVPNVAARLASKAAAGEIVFSEATREAAGLSGERFERRHLVLKGREKPVEARVYKIGEGARESAAAAGD